MHERGLVAADATRLLGLDRPPEALQVTIGPAVDPQVVEALWNEMVAGSPLRWARLVWVHAQHLLDQHLLGAGCWVRPRFSL